VYDLVEVPPAAPPATLTTSSSPSDSEPVVATSDPAAVETTVTEREPASVPLAATSAASMQTIYVPSPVPPRRKGNRGFGVLIALLSSVLFAALYAVAIAAIHSVEIGEFRFDFFGSLAYYTPIAFFFIGFVIVVLLANRASWWSYVLGSLLVGLVVYFGSVGTSLLVNNVFALTPNSAARLFSVALTSPFIIAAALLAREVSMWMGALISARGRKVKVRNLEARDTFDRESAERTAEYEKSRYATPGTTI
jgi:signal transduction histidine kinase